MTKLTIMRGVSGSGKSTIARSIPHAMVVSRDDLRKSLFGSDDQDYYAVPKEVLKAREEAVTRAEHEAIRAGLRAGFHVVSDNTNARMKFLNPIAAIGYAEGAEVEVRVVDVPLATAIERNKVRHSMGGRLVPEKVIRDQHGALSQSKNHEPVRPFEPTPYEGTPGKPKAFLFDLDGTTFHMGDKRGPYDHNVDVDDPDPVVLDIVARLQGSGLYAVAMSGREEVTRDLTMEALYVHGNITPDNLFMRPNKDMRKDSIVKAELFDKFVRDNYDVQFVLDDRNQVVDMWRAMGIKTLQVAPGDF